VVEKAEEQASRLETLRRDAGRMRAKAIEELDQVPPYAPEQDKWAAWEAQDQADELEMQASLEALHHEILLRAALAHAPDLVEAHRALAYRYRERHVEAEGRVTVGWPTGLESDCSSM
jgi:hypothetical protein